MIKIVYAEDLLSNLSELIALQERRLQADPSMRDYYMAVIAGIHVSINAVQDLRGGK